MEPWLDSLSEDWQSEHHSSSLSLPQRTPDRSRPGSVASNVPQSRIPHLAQYHSKNSTNGKYLRSRSLRGNNSFRGSTVLTEQKPSKLNVAAQSPTSVTSESQTKLRATTLPRRTSTALSDSVQSVQHHTLHTEPTRALKDDYTPEWKRRLAEGEDIAGKGCDLFAPIRLEGMFKAPPTPQDENQPPTSSPFDQPRPWSLPTASNSTSTFDHFNSMKASRSRLRGLDMVEEVNEEADDTNVNSHSGHAPGPAGSERGLVKQLTESFELASRSTSQLPRLKPGISSSVDDADLDHVDRDPRTRTMSGQEELRNEWISPVTLSKQNTIRDRALKDSTAKSATVLQAKLELLGIDDSQRPSSRSSNQDVVYGHVKGCSDGSAHDEPVTDLTSQSLPDDLSMGTEDFISHGGFVNKRRGGFSNEGSFHRRTLSPSCPASYRARSNYPATLISHSSPLLPAAIGRTFHIEYLPSASSPITPPSSEQAHYKQPPVGSPLKLFGNRDTYTNNKLIRALSHFEDAESLGDAEITQPDSRVESELRMSRFGQGELDRFDFIEEVKLKARDDAPPVHTDDESLHSTGRVFGDRPSNATRRRDKLGRISSPEQSSREIEDVNADLTKRDSPSPLKERASKRRRTLLREEIKVHLSRRPEDGMFIPRTDSAKLAGTKRKDARYDDATPTVDPNSLAGRHMLRPRMPHQRSSDIASRESKNVLMIDVEPHASTNPGSVAARDEVNEARKTSVTTQDYMEEATKIMQMIRAKGKPKSSLSSVEEPIEESESNPDAILVFNSDEASSGDEFSRPPSRNGGRDLREQQREQRQDPRIASHLRKFKESDDLELLIDTSVLGPMAVSDNARAEEAALVPIPDDEQRSSPPNIRIREAVGVQRKRKHSASTIEDLQVSQRNSTTLMHSSSANSTQRTIPTSSTGSSGRKGVINPGKVQIPDQVGAMTFDHATRTWVKERRGVKAATERRGRQATSEGDPFEHISDLSTEELREAERDSNSQIGVVSRPSTRSSASSNEHVSFAKVNLEGLGTIAEPAQAATDFQMNARSQLVEHETRIYGGQISRAPNSPENINRQPRVVTIAFSSPLVSAVAYQDDPSTSELELSRTAHGSNGAQEPGGTDISRSAADSMPKRETALKQPLSSLSSRYKSWPVQSFVPRPISRIEEQDEMGTNGNLSLILTNQSQAMTPVRGQSDGTLAAPYKAPSIICLTPLSEFSLHQVDRTSQDEASFVAPRVHPGALRQAHGSQVLNLDSLMRALTDAEPSEPYWDHIRRLDLTGKRLTTLHRLEEYCTTLEELIIRTNELGQLCGVPLSVRMLDAHGNGLSNLTSWGHLQNIQYLDVSGNELESLEGLACLYHLRELNANDNKISDIDGILDLNGLQALSLQGNQLQGLDFEGGELARLTRLDASRNHLTHVHSLSWLPALEELNLEQNEIVEIATAGSTYLNSLRLLRMSTNLLKSIDLSMCPKIESLYLDRNSVTEVRSLNHARHLHTISLREQTDSTDIVGHVLSKPNDCRKMFLSGNAVPGGELRMPDQPLYSLQYLELASCGISSIPAGFGSKIPNCRVLNLNFNAIGCISRLQGMGHLNKLLLAGNRLERLRRTCLALSRHPTLIKMDLRDNPLTVGFYSPAHVDNGLAVRRPSQPGVPVLQDPHVLPQQATDVDHKWLRVLDEGTRLRRRTTELLLAQKCVDLLELNGLAFDRDEMLQPDELWEALTELGVLKRPMLLPQRPSSAQEENLLLNDFGGREVLGEEKSLMNE